MAERFTVKERTVYDVIDAELKKADKKSDGAAVTSRTKAEAQDWIKDRKAQLKEAQQ